jgi:hypothetical protein
LGENKDFVVLSRICGEIENCQPDLRARGDHLMNNPDTPKSMNVFKGEESIKDYLNPDKLAYQPLVELPEALNPFRTDGVRIFAKLMTFIGLHNVKAVPAYNMIMEKHNRGELDGVTHLVEN